MKKMFVIIALTFSSLLWLLYTRAPSPFPSPAPTPTLPVPTTVPQPHTIRIDTKTYSYYDYHHSPSNTISLIDNYTQKKDSKTLLAEHACLFMVNGGFYDENSKPLGLVVIQGTTLAPYRKNQLLNGFLSLDSSYNITSVPPQTVKFALQSGPLLIVNHNLQKLTISHDKPRRRLVAATTTAGELSFFVIFNPDTPYGGPYLADLPLIIEAIFSQEKYAGLNALNLDGGTASVFYIKDGILLPEFNPVGSVLCVK